MKHVSVSATFRIKGIPKSQGISSITYTFAKYNHLPFRSLAGAIVATLAEFYVETGSIDPKLINDEIQKTAEAIKTISFNFQEEG